MSIALIVSLTLCTLATVAVAAWRWGYTSQRIRAVAVLPFENLSSDPGQDYFVDGMTDALITDLARIHPLNVISRTSAMHYKGVREPVAKLARELNVDAVVEGSVVRNGSRVRINARLIRAADDRHLWAQSYERDVVSVIALESELAQAVAEAVATTLSPADRQRIAHAHVPPPQAYDDYLRGMHLVNQVTKESELASIGLFESAIAADPQFAAAYAGLAQAYALLGGQTIGLGLRADEALPKATAAARRAVALDPQLAEGWMALGLTIERGGGNGGHDPLLKEAAERAVALSPGDAWAHKRYADYLADEAHDLPSALHEFEHSMRLDPLNPRISSSYGDALLSAGRTEEGFAQLRRTVALNPWSLVPHVKLGFACIDHHHYEEAITEFRKAKEISPDSLPVAVGLAYAEAYGGHVAEAESLLTIMIPQAQALGRPSAVALIEISLHHRAEALTWLQRALDVHDDTFFQWDDRADWLRSDPDYQALARKAQELPAS